MALINVNGRNYHASLTDRDGNVIGLNIVDAAGNDDALAISQSNHPRTPLQTSQGQGEYSDLLLPYKELVQDNWVGGRGLLNARKDATRYLDAGNLDTEYEGQVILRGNPTYATGDQHTISQTIPGDVTWQPLNGDGTYRSVAFTVPNNIATADICIGIWMRRTAGNTEDPDFSITNDNGGDPDLTSLMAHGELGVTDVEEGIAEHYIISNFGQSGLNAGTTYHLVIYDAADSEIPWETACQSGTGGFKSETGAGGSWSSGPAPYYRVFDGSNESKGELFEYKGALYFVEFPESGNSRVLINGDRGAADSNLGDLTKLNDGTKSWTNDEYIDAVVMLTKGPGSNEAIPWRKIIDNTASALEVSPDWNIAHTTETEYVILESDVWNEHATITNSVRDVEVAGEYVFMANRSSGIHRYNERNVAGTWTIGASSTENLIYADILKTIPHPTDGNVLWGAYDDHFMKGSAVFNALVPPAWSATGLFERVAVLDEVDRIWDESYAAGATLTLSRDRRTLDMSIAAGFTTGILASRRLPTPIDVTQGESIGFTIFSDVALGLGDLSLLLDDTHYCGKKYIPDYLYHYDSEAYPSFFLYDASESDNDDKWKQQGNIVKPRDGTAVYRANFTLQSADRIYIGFAQRFDRLKWDIGTVQTNSETMSAKFWNGQDWAAVSGWNDDTESGGVTLAQDGDMTWTMGNIWNPGTHGDQATYLDQSLYWIELTPSDVLTNARGELTIENEQVAVYRALNRAKDGDTDTYEVVTLTADDYIYIGGEFRFERIEVDFGATVSATPSTLQAEYFNGATWESLSISDDGTDDEGDTFALDGTVVLSIQHFDWHKATIANNEAYWIRLSVSADLTPYVVINEMAIESDNAEALGLPAINADEPTFVQLSMTATANPQPDLSNVKSIAFKLNTDLGAQVINIMGPMLICRSPGYISLGNRSDRITGMGVHGAERSNPMVHTETGVYEIKTEEDNAVVALPLEEIKALRSFDNGKANCHNDTYYYFNLGKYVQRYVDGSMENIGPDQDEGLPSEREGPPQTMLSHPARVLLVKNPTDAGPTIQFNDVAGFATVHARRGGGWHEVYRAPRRREWDGAYEGYQGYYSVPIEHIYFQSAYLGIDRLWIAHGGDLVWVPMMPDNPLNHENFTYISNGYLTSGWYDASFVDIDKTFTHLKLATENLSSNATITAEYQLDSGSLKDTSDDDNWTPIADGDTLEVFDTSPSQRIELQTDEDVSCRRIRIRLVFDTNDESITPVLRSTNLQLIFFHPIKEVINFNYRSNDVGVSVDGQADETSTALAFDTTIKGWGTPPANILTFNSQHPSFNGKTVVVQYPSGKPIESDPEGGPEEETLVRELVLMEV